LALAKVLFFLAVKTGKNHRKTMVFNGISEIEKPQKVSK